MNFFLSINLLFLTLTFLSAHAHDNITSYIFQEPGVSNKEFPGLDRMSDGTLILNYGESTQTKYYRMLMCVSKDAGATWSAPREFATIHNAALGLQRRPRLILDRDGDFHAVFEDHRNGLSARMYHTVSTDNGQTWSTPSSVTPDLTNSLQDFGDAALDSNNAVVVTYLSAGYLAADGYKHVYLVRSSNNGNTWSDPVRVDQFTLGGSCECCQQRVAVGPNNEIAVGYRSNINNNRDIHISRSIDGGTSFEPPVKIQSEPWRIDGCPSQGPSLTFDGLSAIHVAWVDARQARDGQPIAYYAKLNAGQTTTPLNIDLSSELSSMSEYPSVAASRNGESVAVSWESSMGVFTGHSTNGGNSFYKENIDNLTVNNGNVNVVEKSNGSFLTVWQANREGKFDIKSYEDLATSTDVPQTAKNIKVRITDNGNIVVANDASISVIRVFNILGQELYHSAPYTSEASILLNNVGVLLLSVELSSGDAYSFVINR